MDDRQVRDLANIRKDLCGELTAINDYTAHAMEAGYPPLCQLFLEIANDEKHHVAELTRILLELDPEERRRFAEVGLTLRGDMT